MHSSVLQRFGRGALIAFATGAMMFTSIGSTSAAKFKVLHSFCEKRCRDGSVPIGALVMDSAGNFFGATAKGGNRGDGSVFELIRKANGGFELDAIFSFCERCQTTGSEPAGSLVLDAQGNLYGTTTDGVVFKLSPSGGKNWNETVLYNFCSQLNCEDGWDPEAGLTYAGASMGAPYDGITPLFGTTANGGAARKGVVFSLTPHDGTWSEAVIYSFCSQGKDKCTDGAVPASTLIMDGVGNLYGTTTYGGGNDPGKGNQGAGTVFELSPSDGNTWTQTVLYRFCALVKCADGAYPGGLVMGSTGALLGPTGAGGTASGRAPCINAKSSGCGAIYELVPNGVLSQESVIYSFCVENDCKDGAGPQGALALDSSGNLFGVTVVGGGNDIDQLGRGGGTVFKISGTSLKTLHRFCSQANCADGEYPDGGLILDQSGTLHGVTGGGGTFANGSDGGATFDIRP